MRWGPGEGAERESVTKDEKDETCYNMLCVLMQCTKMSLIILFIWPREQKKESVVNDLSLEVRAKMDCMWDIYTSKWMIPHEDICLHIKISSWSILFYSSDFSWLKIYDSKLYQAIKLIFSGYYFDHKYLGD